MGAYAEYYGAVVRDYVDGAADDGSGGAGGGGDGVDYIKGRASP